MTPKRIYVGYLPALRDEAVLNFYLFNKYAPQYRYMWVVNELMLQDNEQRLVFPLELREKRSKRKDERGNNLTMVSNKGLRVVLLSSSHLACFIHKFDLSFFLQVLRPNQLLARNCEVVYG